MTTTREFQRGKFSIDSLLDTTFEGFTTGETWNGWACPYFGHDEAVAVLVASENNGYRWFYDPGADTFVVSHIEDPEGFEAQRFEATRINLDNEDIVVYGIGAFSWIWEQVA